MILLLPNSGFSQILATDRLTPMNVKKELAIKGYDPVA